MSKRLSDSTKWNRPFLRKMKSAYKLFWLYLLDECDHAGIWIVDFEVARLKLGEKIDEKGAIENFGDRFIIFDDNSKWFIPDFISFQYGNLAENNRVHVSVIQILKRYNLIDSENKPLISPLLGAKDKERDKDKDNIVLVPKKIEPEKEYPEDVKKFYDFICGTKNVSKMKHPLSISDTERLLTEFVKEDLIDVLRDMENKAGLTTKYLDTNLTIRSWMRMRKKREKEKQSLRQPVSQSFRGNLSGG